MFLLAMFRSLCKKNANEASATKGKEEASASKAKAKEAASATSFG